MKNHPEIADIALSKWVLAIRNWSRGDVLPWTLAGFGLVAAISLILQHGFSTNPQFNVLFFWIDQILAVAFIFGYVIEIAGARHPRDAIHQRRFEILLVGLFCAALALAWMLPPDWIDLTAAFEQHRTRTDLSFGIVRLFLLANVCVQLLRSLQRIFVKGFRTELLLAGSFAALVLSGTLLLLLPRASAKPEAPLSLTDCLFTSTSAVCVTGLSVRDTGADFSTLGQTIILVLFQIGGLGIVTFVAFISAFSKKTLPVPQMVAFREMINLPAMSDLKQQLAGILLLTLLIEFAGSVSLYILAPVEGDFFERWRWSVFHSVSAFCNAGFALQSNSLEPFQSNPGVNWTIMPLIVLGGLGFLVLPELIRFFSGHVRRLASILIRRRTRTLPPPRLTIQSRISLLVSLLLIVIGFAGFWVLEADGLLKGKSVADAFCSSMFQSVTTRTAGFNTVPIGQLQQATLILVIMLMVIGGSPVSTAGGVKTVTFGILLLSLRSLIFQKRNVEAFGRTLPPRAFFTALNVFVLYVTTAAIGVFLVSYFDPHLNLRDTVFETISALSTVGLSTGITADLSTGSKLVLCGAMFIGRVGPIALVLSVFQSRGRVEYEYPTEDVVVG